MTAVFAVVSTPNSHTQVASSSANIAHVSTLNAAADISHPELGGAGRRQLLAECLVNQYVDNGACIACDTGYTRVAGDDPDGVNTACTTCAANYRVDGSNACVPCAVGTTNVAGDDASGVASASALLPVYDAWTDGTVAANFDPAVDDANRVRHTTRT